MEQPTPEEVIHTLNALIASLVEAVDSTQRSQISLQMQIHALRQDYWLLKHGAPPVAERVKQASQLPTDCGACSTTPSVTEHHLSAPPISDHWDQTLFCECCKTNPNERAIRRCLEEGACIVFKPPNGFFAPLHFCVMSGQERTLEILLETPRDVDFTVTGQFQRTALHLICSHFAHLEPHTVEQMKAMTRIIVNRLHTHPNDRVEWGQRDRYQHDFLSFAAHSGVLSDLYPLVRREAFFSEAVRPFELTWKPQNSAKWEADWDNLSIEDQAMFCPTWQ